jgi:hypothetical protein
MRGVMSTSWMGVPYHETPIVSAARTVPTLMAMSTTMLTKRRAVDHCRVRSALCRMR